MNKKNVFKGLGIVCAIGCLIVAVILLNMKTYEWKYQTTNQILYNPMMGFAPAADYIDAVGENRLVYLQLTWREIEPQEGIYDFSSIKDNYYLDRWKKEGKQVVFRLVCDNPSDEKHMDIPDWLYEKTRDGIFYENAYGKGYSPNYENDFFIELHEKLINALSDEFENDDFFCFIELGSLGHWGEWHINVKGDIFPSEEVCSRYVEAYVKNFPNAYLLMRRPFSFVKENGMGLFNDMTGEESSTNKWLSWINNGGIYEESKNQMKLLAVPEHWNKYPVGGEFSSNYMMKEYLTDNLKPTIELLDKSHMTFIGPNCPIACKEIKEYPDETKEILKHVGYRYGVSACKVQNNTLLKKANVQITLNNYGTAPMYADWPVYLYALDENGRVLVRIKLKISLLEVSASDSIIVSQKIDYGKYADNMPILAVGIENPKNGNNEIFLDMNTKVVESKYYLNE